MALTINGEDRADYRSWRAEWSTAPADECSYMHLPISKIAWVTWGLQCGQSARTSCYPWFSPNEVIDISRSTNVFYSPATACPTGWSSVSFAGFNTSQSLLASETAIHCCPSDFETTIDRLHYCQASSASEFTFSICSETQSGGSRSLHTYTRPASPDHVGTQAIALALQIRYRGVDVGAAPETDTNPEGQTNPTGLSNSRSIAATTIVAIVVPIVLIAAVVLELYLFRRYRRKQKESLVAMKTEEYQYLKPELDATQYYNHTGAAAPTGKTKIELWAGEPRQVVIELDASEPKQVSGREDPGEHLHRAELAASNEITSPKP